MLVGATFLHTVKSGIKTPKIHGVPAKVPVVSKEDKERVERLQQGLADGSLKQGQIDCPKCLHRCCVALIKDVEVDICPRCRSIWFDKNELSTYLLARKDVPGDIYHSRLSKYSCPHCIKPMREFCFINPHNLLVDKCEQCEGVFLEEGELDRAVRLNEKQQ